VWFLGGPKLPYTMVSSSLATTPSMRQVAPWVERLARVGYASKALLYFTVGSLAVQAGIERSRRGADTQEALRIVRQATFGRVALLTMAAGLIGYAVWRLVEGLVDPDNRGSGARAVALRISFAARGVLHGALGITALRLALRQMPGPHRSQTRHWTRVAFDLPGGELLVGLAALAIAGFGLYQLYRAYTSKLSRQLNFGELDGGARRWVVGVSRFGIAARGVVFCVIGLFLGRAAIRHDAAKAGGVRESLGFLAGIGRWLFVVVALGLVAYGGYELLNARYRRINLE
jgi:hypothetical protein